MYSDKPNIGILTIALLNHCIEHAVVCPGSRNAPIVHNLHHIGIKCHPVTDERSAGFYALGIALATNRPVVVCVTSGSALLNLAPALTEAQFRRLPIIVVSADRPIDGIDRLQGQTMHQAEALMPFVKCQAPLVEPHTPAEYEYCNRMLNQALISCQAMPRGPVHINVPISEPLFDFSAPMPETQRKVVSYEPSRDLSSLAHVMLGKLCGALRPMIVVGQCLPSDSMNQAIACLRKYFVVFTEPLSAPGACPFNECLPLVQGNKDYMPDFILYVGETIVSKRLKSYLTSAPYATATWGVAEDGVVHDTFGNQEYLTQATAEECLCVLAYAMHMQPGIVERATNPSIVAYRHRWISSLASVRGVYMSALLPFSQMLAVKMFEHALKKCPVPHAVHYANSTPVRLACIYSDHYIYVNRGVNGIEGSVSTACGHSLATGSRVFCVVGDLSFFYDSNALWNTQIGGQARILLLNNSGGSIFRGLDGLQSSPVANTMVCGSHFATAEGLCQSHDCIYHGVRTIDDLRTALRHLVEDESQRPMVVEVFTDPDIDNKTIKEVEHQLLKTL